MTAHLDESLKRDIQRIKEHIQEMARLAVRALSDAVKAIVEDDRQIAYAVILRDQYIDEKEKELDRLCLEFLVRQQPVAGPLRLAYSAIKINLELERVGDYAESIARQALKLSARPKADAAIIARIVEMADLAIPMIQDAVEAFVSQDAELAKKTIVVEGTLDALQGTLNAELAARLRSQALPFETMMPLVTIGRRLERVSDQARNVCMEVLYMCTGETVKHPGADTFRILFADERNACRSQIAEAIAQSLNLPRFIFASAGLDPRPIDATTVAFMRDKGYDLSRVAPKALFQIPYLDHYQVIAALGPEVQQAFPQRPRKTVYLEWYIPDPSRVQGTPETVHAAYEESFAYLTEHVKDLVEAVLGAKLG
jgi:phosphate transport system protein